MSEGREEWFKGTEQTLEEKEIAKTERAIVRKLDEITSAYSLPTTIDVETDMRHFFPNFALSEIFSEINNTLEQRPSGIFRFFRRDQNPPVSQIAFSVGHTESGQLLIAKGPLGDLGSSRTSPGKDLFTVTAGQWELLNDASRLASVRGVSENPVIEILAANGCIEYCNNGGFGPNSESISLDAKKELKQLLSEFIMNKESGEII